MTDVVPEKPEIEEDQVDYEALAIEKEIDEEIAVELKKLKKIYGKDVVAIQGADVSIADKEFVVLVGPSGCGKSTLLRLVANLEQPTRGSIQLHSHDEPPEQRPRVAFVFQEPNLLPWRSVHRGQ